MTNSSHTMEILNFELGTHFPNPTLQNGRGRGGGIYIFDFKKLLCHIHSNTVFFI